MIDNYQLREALKDCLEIWDDLYASACDREGDPFEIQTFERARALLENHSEPLKAYIDIDGKTRKYLVPVKSITITRAEGPSDQCGHPQTVSSFAEASTVLVRNSHAAPKGGGYDKHDFRVEWENGDTYEGRYDLKHYSEDECCIAHHIRNYLKWHIENAPSTPLNSELPSFKTWLKTLDLRQTPPLAEPGDVVQIIKSHLPSPK